MEDSQIVELYWQRNRQAIAYSEEKYGAYCFAVARGILDSEEDAEECVNDTWLHAWNAMPPHRPKVLRMFLAKITRSAAFNLFRKNSAEKRGGGETVLVLEELAECIAGCENVEDEVITEELGEKINAFVRSLPEREGDIFIRRYFFTESVSEIAAGYSISANHTAVILSRVRKKLKKQLVKEGYLYETE